MKLTQTAQQSNVLRHGQPSFALFPAPSTGSSQTGGSIVTSVMLDVVVVLVGPASVVEVVVLAGPASVVEVVVLVVVDDVVVVTNTHWLSMHSPLPHSPQGIGVPQPLSISPHCAPTLAQSWGLQQIPNLSLGFWRRHILLAQLWLTWQVEPLRFPPALLVSAHTRPRI
jgi:hypothetical protein